MLVREDGPTMFYGTHFIMSPPAKSKLKRQGQLLSSVLSRTLSYKYTVTWTPPAPAWAPATTRPSSPPSSRPLGS